jgi:D-alanyl-D-alanine carboxypeptidase/D-alanyl-D-alanine-endopeptidase (penicillin-binding protein 4)
MIKFIYSKKFLISNRLIFLIINLYVIFSTGVASASNIKKLVYEQIKSSNAGDLNLGIYIENLDTGKEKFSLHANRFFIPASVTKVFTAYAVLKYLGQEYQIPTNFISDSKSIKNGQLYGDLYIKFYGNPNFTYLQLVDSFKKLGINAIHGDIIVDDSFLDDNKTSPGGFTWDDMPFYYAAPKSAVIIDKNTAEAWMKPSNKEGNIAQLRIEKPYVLNIINNVETIKPRKETCPYKSKYITANSYEVYGCMFNNQLQEIRLKFSLQDTKLMATQYVKEAIKDAAIVADGSIKIGTAKKGDVIYQHLSMPVKSFLKDILSESCNMTSGAIFKHMAAVGTKKSGSDEDGEIFMREILQKNGLNSSSFYLKDGSGESRYNLVTPKAVVELLKVVYKDKKNNTNFIKALSRYGQDGTLKSRYINGDYGNFIYAKTGSFKGISALAGYYLPNKGPKYAFAIMSNNFRLSWLEAKNLEDKILYLLLDNK